MIISIPRHHLRALQASVARSDPSRPQLEGVFLDLSDKAAPVAVATDGHRMTIVTGLRVMKDDIEDDPRAGTPDHLLFLPVSVPRRAAKADDEVIIDTATRTASWSAGRGKGATTENLVLVDWDYPDWRKLAGRMRRKESKAVEKIGMDFNLMAPIAVELRDGNGLAQAEVLFRGDDEAIEIRWMNEPNVETWLMPVHV